jgi:hypothetical protein
MIDLQITNTNPENVLVPYKNAMLTPPSLNNIYYAISSF